MEQQTGERTEQPTQRKREKARKQGTVAKSMDLVGAAGLLVTALAMPWFVERFGTSLILGFSRLQAPLDASSGTMYSVVMGLLVPVLAAVIPFFAVLMVCGLVANFAQVGFVASAEALVPKWEKINPLQGIKRMFSARAFVEGLKAIVKLLLFGWIAYAAVAADWSTIVGLAWLPPDQAASAVGGVLHRVLVRIAIVWFVLAAGDYVFQRFQTEKQLRMTRDELRREMREQEGSPEMRAEANKRRRRLAKGSLKSQIAKADVVVTNPEHYAVALEYKRNEMHAPVVLAKGRDYLALRIRTLAKEHGIATIPNPPLARRLYRLCDVGDFIPRELFPAVAEILAFVYKSVEEARRK